MDDKKKPERRFPDFFTAGLSEALFRYRVFMVAVAVGFNLISAFFLLIVGLYNGLRAMVNFVLTGEVAAVLSGLIKTMDIFLASLVMMLLAVGIYDIFVIGSTVDDQDRVCRGWEGFATLDDLKSSLAKLIVIILAVTFMELVLSNLDDMTGLQVLIAPAGGVLIAASLWLTSKK
ncbi:MAG: YqhA family protein [Pseudomonadota bacterium]